MLTIKHIIKMNRSVVNQLCMQIANREKSQYNGWKVSIDKLNNCNDKYINNNINYNVIISPILRLISKQHSIPSKKMSKYSIITTT